MKNIRNVLSENFHFLVVKFLVYLNRHVFVMTWEFNSLQGKCKKIKTKKLETAYLLTLEFNSQQGKCKKIKTKTFEYCKGNKLKKV